MSLQRFSSGVVRSSDTEDESDDEDVMAMLERAAPGKGRKIQRPKAFAAPAPVKKEVKKFVPKFDLRKLAEMKRKQTDTAEKIKECDRAIAKANEVMVVEDEDELLKGEDPKLMSVLKGRGASEEDSYGDISEWKFFGEGCSTGFIEGKVENYQIERELECPEWLKDFEGDPLVREQMLLSGFAEHMATFDEDTPIGFASVAQELSTTEPREELAAAYYYVFGACQNPDYTVKAEHLKGISSKYAAAPDRIDLKAVVKPELPKGIRTREIYKNYWRERLMCNNFYTTTINYGSKASLDATAYGAGTMLRAFLDVETVHSAILAEEIRNTFIEIISEFLDDEWPRLEERIVSDFTASCGDLLYHTRALMHLPTTSPRAYFLRRNLASGLLFRGNAKPLTPALIKTFVQVGQPGDSPQEELQKIRDTKARLHLVDILLDDTVIKTKKDRDALLDCITELHTLIKDKPGTSILKTEAKDMFDRLKLRLEFMSGWGRTGQVRLDDYLS